MSLFHHIPPILQKTFQRCPNGIMKWLEYPVTGPWIFHSSRQPKQSFKSRYLEMLWLPRLEVGLVLFFFFLSHWLVSTNSAILSPDLVVYPTCQKWISPTYPTYKQGYNLATKWGEPPSILTYLNLCLGRTGICLECIFLTTIIWPELKLPNTSVN